MLFCLKEVIDLKKVFIGVIFVFILIFSAFLYINLNNNTTGKDIPLDNKNVLVVYFSRTGNTEDAAYIISTYTGGRLHRVSRSVPYPENLKECVIEVSKEMQDNILPEINKFDGKMDKYNVVFLCYPIWLNSVPMPMVSFMEEYDFSGKYIIPVATHSGSGLGNSVSVIKNHCDGAIVLDGISIANGDHDILDKVKEYGF